MQETSYFRGSLVEYWQDVYAEWARYSRGDIHASSPLEISHPFKNRPPKEFEEVILEFLDDDLRRAPEPPEVPVPGITWVQYAKFVFPPEVVHVPVTVRAESDSDGTFVRLTACIEKEAYQQSGKAALSRWRKKESTWQRKGRLISLPAYLSEVAGPGAKHKKRVNGRYFSGIHGMLVKIAHRDYCLREYGRPSNWSDKWQGAIDAKTANSIDRELDGKIKGQWNDPKISGDVLIGLLFKKYKDFEYLTIEWEELKKKEF